MSVCSSLARSQYQSPAPRSLQDWVGLITFMYSSHIIIMLLITPRRSAISGISLTVGITRKGGKVVTIPLAPRTARAIDLAIGERTDGPVFLAGDGRRLDRHGAGRIVRKTARRAGIIKPVTSHTLRHAFITAVWMLGDVQEAASHADPRTTMRYGRARGSLDRHACLYCRRLRRRRRPDSLRRRAAVPPGGSPPSGGQPQRPPGPAAVTRRNQALKREPICLPKSSIRPAGSTVQMRSMRYRTRCYQRGDLSLSGRSAAWPLLSSDQKQLLEGRIIRRSVPCHL